MSRLHVSLLRAALAGAVAVLAFGAAQAEDTKIRIGYPSGMNGQVPVVLEKAGIAPKHQLAAEFHRLPIWPADDRGPRLRQLDAIVTSSCRRSRCRPRRRERSSSWRSSVSRAIPCWCPRDSPARTLADLKGKKIGVSVGSESHLDLVVALKEAKLDPKTDVELINLPAERAARRAGEGPRRRCAHPSAAGPPSRESLGAKKVQTWPFRFTSIVRT